MFSIFNLLFDRLDYVSTVTQELLCIQILEKMILCYCSSFISIWRSILLEFYRNLNHNLNITTHAIDIGLFTTMLWTFEEREKLINFNECISGTRFHAAFLLLFHAAFLLLFHAAFLLMGRLRYDISVDAFMYWLIHYSRQLKEIHNMLSINPLLYKVKLKYILLLVFMLASVMYNW